MEPFPLNDRLIRRWLASQPPAPLLRELEDRAREAQALCETASAGAASRLDRVTTAAVAAWLLQVHELATYVADRERRRRRALKDEERLPRRALDGSDMRAAEAARAALDRLEAEQEAFAARAAAATAAATRARDWLERLGRRAPDARNAREAG